jgi:hypothetical protein
MWLETLGERVVRALVAIGTLVRLVTMDLHLHLDLDLDIQVTSAI